jgi:hypothetical protein
MSDRRKGVLSLHFSLGIASLRLRGRSQVGRSCRALQSILG